MALPLELGGILFVSGIATIAALLLAYGIAGWYERRSRRLREKKLEERRQARAGGRSA